MLGNLALQKLLRDYDFKTVLDVGSGAGEQAAAFRATGKAVTTVDEDAAKGADWQMTLQQADSRTDFPCPFDCVWCCHVLEHQACVSTFLHLLTSQFPFGRPGILALTVPPYKERTVAGHLSIWTPGLLLYNLVCAGIDCSQAAVKCYGYNISVIVRVGQPIQAHNRCTLDKIAAYFPVPVEPGGFDLGMDCEVNW